MCLKLRQNYKFCIKIEQLFVCKYEKHILPKLIKVNFFLIKHQVILIVVNYIMHTSIINAWNVTCI